MLIFSFAFLYIKSQLPKKEVTKIEFNNAKTNAELVFLYSDTINNLYLRTLRKDYGIDTLTKNTSNDIEKIKIIVDWTHNQWEHSGNNEPSKPDALTILKEAKEGNNYRCVEYGIVSSASLNSIGVKARVLGLRTADSESVRYGAGHVVAEAYSKEFNKWIFIDGQFNAIPMLNGIPLNAIEFQKAIIDKSEDLKIINKNGEFSIEDKKDYVDWIGKYLFYFVTNFDNRFGIDNKLKSKSKTHLMLVPLGAKEPTIFQQKYNIDYCLYTNNKNDFYQTPN